jgi:hypothetical protein
VRYEIFAIKDHAIPQASAEFPLDEGEVQLLMRQSLQRSPLMHWRLKFPMAIASDLATVIILRTVFVFKLQDIDKDLCPKYSFALVPLADLDEFSWSNNRPLFQFSYCYEWVISSDTRHLIYRGLNRGPGGKTAGSLLAIYSLLSRETGLEVSLIKCAELADDEGVWQCVPHPLRSEVIFAFRKAIWLCDFRKGMYL